TAQPRLVSMVAAPAEPAAAAAPPRAEAARATASEENSHAAAESRPLAEAAPTSRRGSPRPTGATTLLTGAGVLAFTSPRHRCPTCFGPLRSPDDAAPSAPPAFNPPSGVPSGGVSALTAGDPTSGPVDLTQGVVWYRLPARGSLAP
ncbi:MAG: hypothetical protein JO164_08930, partial [Candidatus Eremiobacteraeota bacterium]|nr:hypothetical protein [Candidatus Eremiobacteraeota bacterium]